jgi:hypothetical protein
MMTAASGPRPGRDAHRQPLTSAARAVDPAFPDAGRHALSPTFPDAEAAARWPDPIRPWGCATTLAVEASLTLQRPHVVNEPIGELADDGVPEPLQFTLNDGVRIMLIPTGGSDGSRAA